MSGVLTLVVEIAGLDTSSSLMLITTEREFTTREMIRLEYEGSTARRRNRMWQGAEPCLPTGDA